MKKRVGVFIFLLVFISLTSLILAEGPSVAIGEEDVEKIENLTGKIPIDPDTGKIDPDRMGFNKSIAEQKIDAINEVIAENASWLKIVFGMVPEISWLFGFNLYLWMFFLVNLVLNGNIFNIVLNDFIEKWKRLIGLCIFTILVVTKIIFNMATFAYNSWDIIWNKVLPLGFVLALIIMVLIAVVLVVLAIYFPTVLLKIVEWNKKRKERKAKEKQELDQKILHTQVNAMQGM